MKSYTKYDGARMVLVKIDCNNMYYKSTLELENLLLAGIDSVPQTINKWHEIERDDDGNVVLKIFTNDMIDPSSEPNRIIL